MSLSFFLSRFVVHDTSYFQYFLDTHSLLDTFQFALEHIHSALLSCQKDLIRLSDLPGILFWRHHAQMGSNAVSCNRSSMNQFQFHRSTDSSNYPDTG